MSFGMFLQEGIIFSCDYFLAVFFYLEAGGEFAFSDGLN